MGYLSDADKTFFKENGYLVVRGAVEPETVDAALDRLWEALDEDRDDPESWIRKGYRTVPVGGEDVIAGTTYNNPVFAMAEELVGKDKLNSSGGAGASISISRIQIENGANRVADILTVTTPLRTVCRKVLWGSFTLGATVYLDTVEKQGGGFTVWPGSHRIWAEYFRHHDLDSLPGGVAPFDLGPSYEFTGEGRRCLFLASSNESYRWFKLRS